MSATRIGVADSGARADRMPAGHRAAKRKSPGISAGINSPVGGGNLGYVKFLMFYVP